MNAVQSHLMLNHIPVLAPLLAALLVAAGLAFRSQPILRVALALLVFAALMAVPVYLTGEPVEEVTKALPGVTEAQIDLHEDTALVSLILLGALGLAAAAALSVYRRRPVPGDVGVAILIATFMVAGQVAWTAHLGGQIRHTELQGASTAVTTPTDHEGDGD
jgi:hypothetical protein